MSKSQPIPTAQLRLFWRHYQSHDGGSFLVGFERARADNDGIRIQVAENDGIVQVVDAPVSITHDIKWPDFLRGYFNIELWHPNGEWCNVFASYHRVDGVLRQREIQEGDEGEIVFPAEGILTTVKADEYARSPAGQESFMRNIIKAFFPDAIKG